MPGSRRPTTVPCLRTGWSNGVGSRTTRCIFVVPQLDGRPSWEPQPTPLTASRGTRARSSARRLRSSSRTSGHFEFVFRWRAECASSHSSTWASTASFAACDLVALKVRDVCHGDQVASRAVVMQHKTQRPVQFEITSATRDAVQKWIKHRGAEVRRLPFPEPHSRLAAPGHAAVRSNPRRLGRGAWS